MIIVETIIHIYPKSKTINLLKLAELAIPGRKNGSYISSGDHTPREEAEK